MIQVGVSESDSEVDSLSRVRSAGVVVSASRGVGECSLCSLKPKSFRNKVSELSSQFVIKNKFGIVSSGSIS
mgnify:CR=1 FL=1